MRRFDPGLLLVGLVLLLCAAVAAPTVVLAIQGADVTRVPLGVWIAVFAGFLIAYLATTILSGHPSRLLRTSLFVLQQACAIATVLLMDGGLGFVAVILVFGAALAVYVLPLWGTAIVVAVNTAAILVVTMGTGFENQAASTFFYLAIQVVSVFTVATWRAQERVQKDLARAHVELAATSALLEQSTRSEERLRISRDLHDVVGHQLTALALELEIATHHATGPTREHVVVARGIAKDLLGDVRETVSRLREAREPLEKALAGAVAGVPSPDIALTVDPDIIVDAARTTALVRVTQEIVTNAVRHAEAATRLRIDVSRTAEPASIVLDAQDDGWGPREIVLGNGLRGMRERAEALGGSAEFSRGGEGGFHVRVAVPL